MRRVGLRPKVLNLKSNPYFSRMPMTIVKVVKYVKLMPK
jgi:hypothetical protein